MDSDTSEFNQSIIQKSIEISSQIMKSLSRSRSEKFHEDNVKGIPAKDFNFFSKELKKYEVKANGRKVVLTMECYSGFVDILPNEIWMEVFLNVEFQTCLRILCSVCSKWREIILSDCFTQFIFRSKFKLIFKTRPNFDGISMFDIQKMIMMNSCESLNLSKQTLGMNNGFLFRVIGGPSTDDEEDYPYFQNEEAFGIQYTGRGYLFCEDGKVFKITLENLMDDSVFILGKKFEEEYVSYEFDKSKRFNTGHRKKLRYIEYSDIGTSTGNLCVSKQPGFNENMCEIRYGYLENIEDFDKFFASIDLTEQKIHEMVKKEFGDNTIRTFENQSKERKTWMYVLLLAKYLSFFEDHELLKKNEWIDFQYVETVGGFDNFFFHEPLTNFK